MYNSKSLWRHIQSRFFREDDGAITVEEVLVGPGDLFYFVFITDVSLMFHGYSKALRVAEDTNRHASTEFYDNETDLEAMAKANLAAFAPNASVSSVL